MNTIITHLCTDDIVIILMWIRWWEENEIDKKATIKKDLVIKISNAKDWLKSLQAQKLTNKANLFKKQRNSSSFLLN